MARTRLERLNRQRSRRQHTERLRLTEPGAAQPIEHALGGNRVLHDADGRLRARGLDDDLVCVEQRDVDRAVAERASRQLSRQ